MSGESFSFSNITKASERQLNVDAIKVGCRLVPTCTKQHNIREERGTEECFKCMMKYIQFHNECTNTAIQALLDDNPELAKRELMKARNIKSIG